MLLQNIRALCAVMIMCSGGFALGDENDSTVVWGEESTDSINLSMSILSDTTHVPDYKRGESIEGSIKDIFKYLDILEISDADPEKARQILQEQEDVSFWRRWAFRVNS